MIRRILLVLLLFHSVITFYVLRDTGYWSVLPPFNELYAYQIFSDLVVSLAILLLFLWLELKRKQKPMKPLVLVGLGMILLGSFSPLIYLLIDKELFD